MIAPPPNQPTSPSEVVEGEGKIKYLQTLESRLNRLQGNDKRKLKSKDILNALSEARDDHLSSPTMDTQPARLDVTETQVATNDPWATKDSGGYITDLSGSGNMQETEEGNDRVFSLDLDYLDENEQDTQSGCLPCCKRRKNQYRQGRVRVTSTSSNLTPEEESAFLLHCDHLSRT